jgi:membrane-bound serine protease (ClpP class)
MLGLFLVFSFHAAPARPVAAAPAAQDAAPVVYVLTFDGAVTPVLERYLENALRAAQADNAAALVLQLDTPGGSVEVTKAIVQRMLAAPLPIIVYVAPTGAQAGSAGTFVTLAAHLAAMAPGTSIGAASPVGSGGEEIGETLAAKVRNILSADIENLAARRGEAATEWAIAAVQEAAAATANQALDLGVVDLVAADLAGLLDAADGRTVTVAGAPWVLRTAGAVTVEYAMTLLQRLLNLLADPTVATILLSLGITGLLIEIRAPGFGAPGILGVVALLLAFYGLGQLDANLTGLALIALALILFVAEAFTPAFGALAIGGVISFILGASLLYDRPGMSTPWAATVIVALALGGLAVFAGTKALAAQRAPVLTGREGLVGRIAIAKQGFAAGEEGSVFVHGEWWNARLAEGRLAQGERARVVAVEGITLIVTPLEQAR